MKLMNRILTVVAILACSTLGGFLANRVGAGLVKAAPVQAAFGPNVKLTLLAMPATSTTPDDFGATAVKIADIGTFTAENGSSLVEVTHQGRLLVDAISGTGSVIYELRVDGVTSANSSGLALYRYQDANQYINITFSGYWYELPAGTHTVSMWVRTNSAATTATNARINPGNWSSNLVIVKEYLPFGSTYLPSVAK